MSDLDEAIWQLYLDARVLDDSALRRAIGGTVRKLFPDRVKAEYRRTHREEIRAADRDYAREHRAEKAAYRREHREAINATKRAYKARVRGCPPRQPASAEELAARKAARNRAYHLANREAIVSRKRERRAAHATEVTA